MMLTKPNDFVAEVHDRMPMLLKPEQFERWLSGDMRVEDLKPVNNDYLYRWPVSKRVNSSKADSNDSTLIAKWAKRHTVPSQLEYFWMPKCLRRRPSKIFGARCRP